VVRPEFVSEKRSMAIPLIKGDGRRHFIRGSARIRWRILNCQRRPVSHTIDVISYVLQINIIV
jgi:hypothetical protein